MCNMNTNTKTCQHRLPTSEGTIQCCATAAAWRCVTPSGMTDRLCEAHAAHALTTGRAVGASPLA